MLQTAIYSVGFHADIWSLGMLLFSAIFGKETFEFMPEGRREECVYSPTCYIPTFSQVLHPAFVPLRPLVEKCLRRDPYARPSITKLIDETATILNKIGYTFPAALELIALNKQINGTRLY